MAKKGKKRNMKKQYMILGIVTVVAFAGLFGLYFLSK